jgi:hypothetical protein
MDIYKALIYLNLLARIRKCTPGHDELSIVFYDNIGGKVMESDRIEVFSFNDPEDLLDKLKAAVKGKNGIKCN